MRCSSSSSHRSKKTPPGGRDEGAVSRLHSPGVGSVPPGAAVPGRARGAAAAGPGGKSPCPARRRSARPLAGQGGERGMCRLWAGLAHPGKQEVGHGQTGGEQPAKRERNFRLNSAEQNPRSFGFSSSVKKLHFLGGETKPNCQTFQLITLQKCSRLLPVSAVEPLCPVNSSVTNWL